MLAPNAGPFPSPTLARYTARLFLVRTVAFLAGLVLILQTLDLLGESGRILAAPGNSEADLWRYVALRVPQLVALFLPFSVLLATLLTFMTLNQNSEVVIFKAAGLSAHQILAPFLVAGLLVAAIAFVFNETVLTRAQEVFDRWKAAEYRAVPPDRARRDIWVRSGEDLVRAAAATGSGDATILRDVTLYDRADDRLVAIVTAARARPIDGGWRFEEARRFTVADGGSAAYSMLDLPLAALPEQFTVTAINGRYTPFWELLPAIRAQEAAGKPVATLRAQLHHKVAGPMSAALMPLLGAVAAFGLARSGKLFVRAVIGLALGFAYFVAENFAMAMADFGSLPPLAAAWAPFLLFLLIGEAILFRTEE